MIPVVSFIGYGSSGKTTFLTKVIAEVKRRGLKAAVIKHDVHDFEMDKPGKDTWRHAQAGADIVCISSPKQMAFIKKVEQELTLDEIIQHIEHVDIIFTEGFKQEHKPKIEVYRQASGQSPIGKRADLLAVVSDIPLYEGVPSFGLEDDAALVNFILVHFGINDRRNQG